MQRARPRSLASAALVAVLAAAGCRPAAGSPAAPGVGLDEPGPRAAAGTALPAPAAAGTTTRLTVRVIARGGKFLGDDIGGARVTVKEVATGAILARGTVAGGSGDTAAIMAGARRRATPVPTTGASAFEAELAVSEPTEVEITAEGPSGGLQSSARVSGTYWLVPGHDMTEGDGVLLELPGLLVQVMEPATHTALASLPQAVRFEANVAMMCGCPIAEAGPWPASDFAVVATIRRGGGEVATVPLTFTGRTSHFAGEWTVADPGFYTADVTAAQHGTTNTGAGRVTFFAAPP